VITPFDLGRDEDLAREVLILARDIAPCLDSFADESEPQKNVIAILRRVYKEITDRGSRFVKGQRIGPASIEYAAIASAFDGHPRRALQALCAAESEEASRTALPLGSFPLERPVGRIWPESYGPTS
jgi:hypothetical protein